MENKKNYKSYDELPLTLTASDLSRFLGISKCSVYALFRREDFPTIKIGSRLLVSRERFFEWLSKQERKV